MSKVLFVRMINPGDPYCGTPAISRIVQVPLTTSQEELLIPRVVGTSGGKNYFELMEPLSIQESKDD
jgi:hypothetical protein